MSKLPPEEVFKKAGEIMTNLVSELERLRKENADLKHRLELVESNIQE